ncbi:recombinase family protein [Ligilactobacillus ceti]|nr:recombinase family protein [Ligilactobacillus ceti]
MKEIIQIKPKKDIIKDKKKVCAYARVSMDTSALRHSLSMQVSYYNKFIQANPSWEFKGVFADLGISGTSIKKRTEFNKMLAECDKGNIDIILTKSIQRFARNTVDLLETVRELKAKGIEVRFEKENINSMSSDGELMLSILASFAQEESKSISDNVKWGIKKRIEKGMVNAGGKFQIFGYRWIGETLTPYEPEASIVKKMYELYAKGDMSFREVAKEINKLGVKSIKNNEFCWASIKCILTNPTYTGNMVFKKEYITEIGNKKMRKNYGEVERYRVENSHEGIITQELFDKVQEIKEKRSSLHLGPPIKDENKTEFSGKLKCMCCGSDFVGCRVSVKRGRGLYWKCYRKDKKRFKDEVPCNTAMMSDLKIKRAIAEALNLKEYTTDYFNKNIEVIEFYNKKDMVIRLKNGEEVKGKYKKKGGK